MPQFKKGPKGQLVNGQVVDGDERFGHVRDDNGRVSLTPGGNEPLKDNTVVAVSCDLEDQDTWTEIHDHATVQHGAGGKIGCVLVQVFEQNASQGRWIVYAKARPNQDITVNPGISAELETDSIIENITIFSSVTPADPNALGYIHLPNCQKICY